jgi:hypothetical protein
MNRRSRRRKNNKQRKTRKQRKQRGGSGIGDIPYRGIPKNAVLANPMKWSDEKIST